MTDELKPCPVNGKHMSAAHEKACLVCSPRPTPPADAELDALVKLAHHESKALEIDTYSHAAAVLDQCADAIEALRERVERLERLCIESVRYMEEDFPEALEELDRACVSGPYLSHYKKLLEVKALAPASDAMKGEAKSGNT